MIKEYLDKLVELLKGNEQLSGLITGIFYSIPANQSYPFLHLANINIRNYPVKMENAKEVTFDLTIYAKSHDFAKLNLIYNIVAQILESNSQVRVLNSKITLTNKTNIYENKMTLQTVLNHSFAEEK